jgi:hypothetical protein
MMNGGMMNGGTANFFHFYFFRAGSAQYLLSLQHIFNSTPAIMKDHLNALLETAKMTGAVLKEKASAAGQAAADSVIAAIEKWLEEFPKIESYGLQIRTFSFVMGLSPSLEVEMVGSHDSFTPDKIAEILKENKAGSLTGMVFTAVKTTYKLHSKISQQPDDPLIIRIKLALSPEIAVFIGRPRVV